MSDRINIINMLEHGDILIRQANNGCIIHYLNPNSDKTYTDSKEINPGCLEIIANEFDDEEDTKRAKEKIVEMLCNILYGMDISYNKHNRFNVDIGVEDQGPPEALTAI